jgi:hypothetical protein
MLPNKEPINWSGNIFVGLIILYLLIAATGLGLGITFVVTKVRDTIIAQGVCK